MLRDPGIAELAAMVAELPDEMQEAMRVAIKKFPHQKEKGEALVIWEQRVLRRAGDELDKLSEG